MLAREARPALGARALLAGLVALALPLTPPPRAQAQPITVVVPTADRQDLVRMDGGERRALQAQRMLALGSSLPSHLRRGGALEVLTGTEALRRARRLLVRAVTLANDHHRATLEACHREVEEHLARNRRRRAVELADDCLRALDATLPSLLRDEEQASRVLSLCLARVEATIGPSGRAAADFVRAEVLRCRRLVPGLDPGGALRSSEMRQAWREAHEALAREEVSTMRVEADRDGCRVHVQGRPVGLTPLRLTRLFPGQYLVQVECDDREAQAARVVELGRQEVVIRADGLEHVFRADATLAADVPLAWGRFALIYDEDADEQAGRLHHGVSLARALGAEELWLVGAPVSAHPDVLRIDRVRVADRRVLAAVRLSAPWSAPTLPVAALARARAALRAGRCVDLTGGRERPLDPDPAWSLRCGGS